MIKGLLNAIKTTLQDVEKLAYIDEDWGQLEYEVPPVKYPCALIDVGEFRYEQIGDFAQRGTGSVYVTIADIKLNRTSSQAPESQKEESMLYFDLLQSVYESLQMKQVEGFDYLQRSALMRVENSKKMRVFRLIFSTQYREG